MTLSEIFKDFPHTELNFLPVSIINEINVYSTFIQWDNKINQFILYNMGTIANKTELTRPHLGGTTQ